MSTKDSTQVFTTLARGLFSSAQVMIKWQPVRRRLPEDLRTKIEAHWQETVAQTEKGRHLFNGQLCRLDGWQASDRRLVVELGMTDYRELLYSNYRASELLADFGQFALSRALGISAVVASCDGQIVLIRRSDNVGECPGMLDVFGGHIDPGVHSVAGKPDPFLAMQEELVEECQLHIDKTDLRCIGLIETVETRKPEMIFFVETELVSEQIVAKAVRAASAEIAEVLVQELDELDAFMTDNITQISPSACGALSLFRSI